MQRILGIDFGEKNTGVAIAESQHAVSPCEKMLVEREVRYHCQIAPSKTIRSFIPITTITTRSRKELIRQLTSIIDTWMPDHIVIGVLPIRHNGGQHRISRMAIKLARQLHGHFHLSTDVFDETLTSASADTGNAISGFIPIDQAAAIELLRGYCQAPRKDLFLSE